MVGKFQSIKKMVILLVTLVIMTSQLVGCATLSSQERLEGIQESPDADDSSIGVIGVINEQDQEKRELSDDALIRYFNQTYELCSGIDSSSLEEQINFELEMLLSFTDTDVEELPSDYADQYRAWRPVDEVPAVTQEPQQPQETTKPSTSNNGGGSSQIKPNRGDQNTTQQQTAPSNDGSPDPYEGLTPEEKETILKELEEATKQLVDETQGTMH